MYSKEKYYEPEEGEIVLDFQKAEDTNPLIRHNPFPDFIKVRTKINGELYGISIRKEIIFASTRDKESICLKIGEKICHSVEI